MAAPNMSMKLLIDPKGRRVLFAEAGKDVVDFLFSILSLPLGTVARLQNPKDTVGGIGNLYQSIDDLRDLQMIPNKNIDNLLNNTVLVTTPNTSNSSPMLITTGNQSSPTKKSYYRCSHGGYNNCLSYVTHDPKSLCPTCRNTMSSPLSLVCSKNDGSSSSSSMEGGFVKGCVTYMIMDDLVVKPMSTISSITLFNRLNLKEMSALEEKTVNLTIDEGKKLLKASLQTKKVLTSVFFEEKIVIEEEKSLESVE
ncbi:uncharacterized protein LOC119989524 [Tripterygium wilfordii]|uniref:uncharacterized protein LOC119989524 n=1 Tax=Tripterygium wilfordii TaxID=458696 RepID=UPI0018F82A69|nr:uncharacterized protein LOC119989524 [Tripterygium wilfordii]